MPGVGSLEPKGGSTGSNLQMGSQNAREGGPDLGTGTGAFLRAKELDARTHFVTPAPNTIADGDVKMTRDEMRNRDVPYYYNNFDGLPVPYSAPSAQKDRMLLRSAIRDAAGAEVKEQGAGGVLRTDPISEEEVDYLKSMQDQVELAKFDEYVESFIDPRQPGNMKWLMEVYPDYVKRRLQQAHTDYEYALRNQMIDSWGINTFDDLHFKYLVDQGKVDGPSLQNGRPALDSKYAPGYLSYFNFQSPKSNALRFPFASAKYGRRPAGENPNTWAYSRANRPMGQGDTPQQLARGMFNVPNAGTPNGQFRELRGP
jgi:hypothetical protein